ncbi:DRAM2 [Acanthosepion pharaonis]|uniref:DRAM2 n=1 Tax=Acanthosepion pharaonis TaxID=158019 RepID=A0A812DY17_ACAPH|nr:DRAM2 [Sepia pharaonis]
MLLVTKMLLMGLEIFPLSLVVLSLLTFITTYIIAVSQKHVTPYLPYISDTGSKSPESCIFGQLLNISTMLGFLGQACDTSAPSSAVLKKFKLSFATMYVRYKLVASMVNIDSTRLHLLNKISLGFGIIAAFGMSVVGNFQESNVLIVHLIGALMVFGVGALYAILQSIISYKMYPEYNGLSICRIRAAISCFSSICFITTFAAAAAAGKNYKNDPLHWQPEMKGFAAHIVSTASEWLLAISFLSFFMTYIKDFRKVEIDIAGRVSVSHLDDCTSDYLNERSPLLR